MYPASGGPKQHALPNHSIPLTREDLVNNTKILFTEFNHNKLSITEALLIQKLQPSINNRYEQNPKTFHLATMPYVLFPALPTQNSISHKISQPTTFIK